MCPRTVAPEIEQFVSWRRDFTDLSQPAHIESHSQSRPLIGPALAFLKVEAFLDVVRQRGIRAYLDEYGTGKRTQRVYDRRGSDGTGEVRADADGMRLAQR